MSNSVVAKRYAVALFELAKEKQLLAQLEIEARNLKEILSEVEDLNEIFTSPKFSKVKRNEIVDSMFETFSIETRNTIKLMAERHHFAEVVSMLTYFIEMANEANSVFDCTVISAKPLTTDEENSISSAFAKKVGVKELNITNVVDSSIIGGLKVRIGNQVFDSSLSTKLKSLQREIRV